MMEWSTDTKTGYDDLEVYMEYGYVFVSTTGRNHIKMAAFTSTIESSLEVGISQLQSLPDYPCWVTEHRWYTVLLRISGTQIFMAIVCWSIWITHQILMI